jgi:hypothetical protein
MPEGGKGLGWRVLLLVLIVAPVVVVIAVAVVGGGDEAAPPPPSSTPSPSPPAVPPPTVDFDVDVRRIDRVAVSKAMRRTEVRAAVREVRHTVEALYRTAFVDPAAWGEGTFPALVDSFAPGARPGARRDLGDLTLGPIARRLDTVDPRRARVDVGVLVGDRGHPMSATAAMDFAAIGVGSAVGQVSILHQGRYVLRPFGEQWLVVAYEVRGRVGGGR